MICNASRQQLIKYTQQVKSFINAICWQISFGREQFGTLYTGTTFIIVVSTFVCYLNIKQCFFEAIHGFRLLFCWYI